MTLFNQILVPLDGTPMAASALPVARALAEGTDAGLVLLTVLSDATQPGQTREPIDNLEDLAGQLRSGGLAVQTAVRPGDPAETILAMATETHAGLVVMATHGRTGVDRVFFGSVADHVLHKAAVPVVLLRPEQEPRPFRRLRTLVVSVDGKPGGALALSAAVPLARATGARLILVRAAVPLPLWIYDPTLGLDTGPLINPMWNEDARASAEVYTQGLAGRLQRVGLAAEGRAISGAAATAIICAAEDTDADLIVMSTHALVGPVRSLLGSVAGTVVRQANRPVLLMRRGSSAGLSSSGIVA